MPERNLERLDAAARALATLDGEARRLERLGFELPLARLHEERRYWRFLHALFTIAEPDAGHAIDRDPWPVRDAR
jgi:hypothetical protein